jgi:hypothetical protein
VLIGTSKKVEKTHDPANKQVNKGVLQLDLANKVLRGKIFKTKQLLVLGFRSSVKASERPENEDSAQEFLLPLFSE